MEPAGRRGQRIANGSGRASQEGEADANLGCILVHPTGAYPSGAARLVGARPLRKFPKLPADMVKHSPSLHGSIFHKRTIWQATTPRGIAAARVFDPMLSLDRS